MDYITSNSLRMLERSADFLWARQATISNNITNAETPGYKTQYVTFEEALNDKLQSIRSGSGYAARVRQALEEAQVQVHEAEEATRMDDNGVNVTEQSVELIRNAYQMQYVYKALTSDFSILRTAIGG